MQILLVAATELEIAPFLAKMPSADILVSGVGCPATLYHLTKRLQQMDYDMLIQAGIAGSFTQELALGDIVLVKEDSFADIGISEKGQFYTVFEKGLADENLFPFKNGWLKNDTEMMDRLPMQQVTAVTVNTITDNKIQIEQIVSKFKPQIETMEGAALHYICLQENIPFMQLRSISNYVGERDKSKWKMKEAIENLNEKLIEIANALVNSTGKPRPNGV